MPYELRAIGQAGPALAPFEVMPLGQHFNYYEVFPLGQAPQPLEPQPLLDLPPEAYAKMAEVWTSLREQCQRVLSPSQCVRLLGYRPYGGGENGPGGFKWWHYLVGGFILGRLMR